MINVDPSITVESIRDALDLGNETAAMRDPLAVGSVAVGMILAGIVLLETTAGTGRGIAEAHRLASIYMVNDPMPRPTGAGRADHGVIATGAAILPFVGRPS